MTLSTDELEAMLERASRNGAELGVRETFTSLGVDTSTPAARIEMQDDMRFLRNSRKRAATLFFAMAGGMATAAGAIAEGVHWLVNGKHGG